MSVCTHTIYAQGAGEHLNKQAKASWHRNKHGEESNFVFVLEVTANAIFFPQHFSIMRMSTIIVSVGS